MLRDEGAVKSAGVGKQGHTRAPGVPGDHCHKRHKRGYGEHIVLCPPLHPRGPFSAGIITGAPAVQWVPRVHSQPTAEAAAAAEVSGARGGTPGVCQPRRVTVVHPGVVVVVVGGKAEKGTKLVKTFSLRAAAGEMAVFTSPLTAASQHFAVPQGPLTWCP